MKRLVIIQLMLGLVLLFFFVLIFLGCLLDVKYQVEADSAISNSTVEAIYGIVHKLSIPFIVLFLSQITCSILLLRRMRHRSAN